MPDLRALRVAQTTSQLLQAKHLKQQPAWLPTVARIPPSTDISRKPPPSFHANKPSRDGKARKIFELQRIRYTEDRLRQRFYKEHPWELARPVLLVEDSGRSSQKYDWSRIAQKGKQLSGESVIQRQLYLMKTAMPRMTTEDAYRTACEEFYRLRRYEALEKRIAVEEAMAYGTEFNKSQTEIGLELEQRVVEQWREKAVAAKSLVQPITPNDILASTSNARARPDRTVSTTDDGEVYETAVQDNL